MGVCVIVCVIDAHVTVLGMDASKFIDDTGLPWNTKGAGKKAFKHAGKLICLMEKGIKVPLGWIRQTSTLYITSNDSEPLHLTALFK